MRGIVIIFGNIFRTIVALIFGRMFKCHSVMLQQHIVKFITSEQVHTFSVDRSFGKYLILAVRIGICCDIATDGNAVLIGKRNNVIEGVLWSFSLLHFLFPFGILNGSLLLELRHTCQVCRISLLLYGFFCQREDIHAVRYVNCAVPIIHNTVFVGYNLNLYLCVISCNGVCIAGVECNHTVNLVGCFLCELLNDSLLRCHFLIGRVQRLINVQYGIGRHLFKCACFRITHNDTAVRSPVVNAAAVCILHKVSTHHIHTAVVLLHRSPLYHAGGAVGACVNHCVALLHTCVYIITHTLNHAVIYLFGIEVVNNRFQLAFSPKAIVPHFLQCIHRMYIQKAKRVFIHYGRNPLPLVVTHILGIGHFLWVCEVVTVNVAFIH